MKQICVIWLSILLMLSSTFLLIDVSEDIEGKVVEYNGVEYVPHAPIRIDSNAEFDEAHGVVNWATGDGSPGNPWIIEGWDINGSALNTCIFIGNTTHHFEIRNCRLHDANGTYNWPYFRNAGIHLYYASNGTIESNIAHLNDKYGLSIFYSNNCNITNNTFYDTGWGGIYSEASNYNTYIGNNLYHNLNGVCLGWSGASIGSHHNKIINNNVTENRMGITVARSNYNTVENNYVSWNELRGILIDRAFYNTIQGNNASNIGNATDDSGISLFFCGNNVVTNNTLLNNYIGITNRYSTNNTLRNNTMEGGGIYFMGTLLEYYNSHSIDLSNTINNKPVYYWKNRTSGTVPSEAGQVILANCSNVTIENFNNQNIYCGIQVGFSENVTIINNTAANTVDGFQLTYSNYNTIQNNAIFNNGRWGLDIYGSNRNDISNNSFLGNWRGLFLHASFSSTSNNNTIHNNNVSFNTEYGFYITAPSARKSDNYIFHNNFINNGNQSYNYAVNFWNLSYPGGGNYWSNYTGVDEKSGPGQDQPGSDGFGDSNYSIEGEGGCFDEYPLMMPFEFEFTNHNLSLSEGWNLVSLPLIQSDEALDNVIESIDGKWDHIQAYDTLADQWKTNLTYRPDQLNDLKSLNHKMGFWINITETNVNLTVSGYISTSTTIPLYAGWNLVGYPSLTNETVANSLWGTGADEVEVFDPAEPYRIKEVEPTYIMKPGEGYWVHVPADTVWVIDW